VVLLRDPREERYPDEALVPGFSTSPPWFWATFHGHEPADHLAFLVEGHRDAGPTTSIDLDTVNVPPALDLIAAQLTLQIQPLTPRKTLPLNPLTIHHAPTTLQSTKHLALQAPHASHTPQPLTGTKHHTLTTAVQTLTAPTPAPSKHLALTGASQTLTAHVLASPTAEEASFEVGQPYTNWEVGQPW